MYANRAVQTSSTVGTGAYQLDGASPGLRSLTASMASIAERLGLPGGAEGPWKVRYTATGDGKDELGIGTLTPAAGGGFATLARDEVVEGANGAAAVSWPPGIRTIAIMPHADSLASLAHVDQPLGAVQRTGRDRYGWGLVADGETDNADALEAAINGANGQKILLPPGTLRVSRALNITADAFHLCGEKAERGQPTLVIDNAGTVIDASEIEAGQWFISRYETSNPASIIGPFVVENLGVLLGAAHGFEFGRADLAAGSLDRANYDLLQDALGQRYVFGVQFRNVRIKGTDPVRNSDAGGVLPRSGQRLIMLTKAFEVTIENLSTRGGDIAVETWGADCIVIDNVRLNHNHIPLLLQRSGFFGAVQNRVQRFQSEHYTFGCIIADSIAASIIDYRCEANVNFGGVPAKHGRWDMTDDLGITCAVTADLSPGTAGIVIPFSENMEGIIHPYASLLRIFNDDHSEYVWPIAVSGANVTVWSLAFAFDWSDATANVERIHGYSIFGGGTYNVECLNGDPEAYLSCPTFVYLKQSGSMYVKNAGKNPGLNNPTGIEVSSVVIGNKVDLDPNFNAGLYMDGVSSSLSPEPHPLAWHADYPAQKGWHPQNAGFRMARRTAPDEIADVPGFRQWAFTPDGYTITTDGLDARIVRKVAGDADTEEKHSVWEIPTTAAATFYNKTIPSQARGTALEVVIVARARSVATTMTWQVLGVGGSLVKNVALGTDWAIVRVPYNGVPTQWGSGRTGSNAGIRIVAGDQDIQVRAVFVREKPIQDMPNGHLARASYRKFLGISGGPPKTSGAVAMAVAKPIAGAPNNARLRVQFSATSRGGTQGYCWVSGEYLIHMSTYSGTAAVVGAIVEKHKTQQSLNAGVLALDVTITVAGSGSDLTVSANASLSGSSNGSVTEVIAYMDVEVLGEPVQLDAA